MNLLRSFLYLAGVGLLISLIAPEPALAYLDPGTGSMVFQWVIAGMVGSAFAIRMFIKRMKSTLGKTPTEETEDAED